MTKYNVVKIFDYSHVESIKMPLAIYLDKHQQVHNIITIKTLKRSS
jgi:hypothetical protein